MADRPKLNYWLAVVDGQLVRFSDLAHMMATALHPEGGIAYGAARINLEDELKLAVRDGLLKVRNRAGLGFHTFPHGDALQRAVLIPGIDLEPFLNARGIELRITPHGNGPDYWTLENAAAAMQEQLSWHDGTRAEFQDQMQEAAASGALVVLNPRTCLPYRPETVRTFWEYVSPESVNAWLTRTGKPYQWKLQSVATKPHAHAPLQVVFGAPPALSSVGADGYPVFDSAGYAQYLKAKSARNAQGRYTIAEAAQVLADAHGLEPAAFIERRMLPAIAANMLHVIDPTDGGPMQGRKCNVYADEVTPAGIDAWLSAEGFAKHVRWPEPAAISAAPDDTKTPEKPQTQPLPTNTVAQLFDGIAFTQERWIKNIGQAKWLASANRGKGEQGGAPATWCPLTIAQLVYAHEKDTRAKQKTLTSLNSRFRTNPVLKPWKNAWDDYYGMFTEPGEAK